MTILTRRAVLVLGAGALASLAWRPARAQDAGATAFIESFGNRLVAVVNGEGSLAEKEQAIRPLIDAAVDVNGIALFCLGAANAGATPAQRQQYLQLFHGVLVNNITAKIGQFRGVSFRMTTTAMRGADAYVGTTVTRPNEAPADVKWVVSSASGAPKIVDVVAAGTSLRLTQRSDYASYLGRNGGRLDALLQAMQRQAQG